MQLESVHLILLSISLDQDKLVWLPATAEQDAHPALPTAPLYREEAPGRVVENLAKTVSGSTAHIKRHGFYTREDTGQDGIYLLYIQLVPLEALGAFSSYLPLETLPDTRLSDWEKRLVQSVVDDMRGELKGVMRSIENKKGLRYLLDLLPDIFNRKELDAAYKALNAGEKAASSFTLARMMLGGYQIGNKERKRFINGRNLIREYFEPAQDLLDEKSRLNRELYRTGGPKAKRLYKKMTHSMLYFSYGSNMSLARLQERVPSAHFVAMAYLEGHTMAFSKAGYDGSAKCGIEETKEEDDRVYGVVFELNRAEKQTLDACEGLGVAYEERDVVVMTAGGDPLRVLTYYPLDNTPGLAPWHWYKEHVLRGAWAFDLPADYIADIEAVAAKEDPDTERAQQELAIYA